MYISLFVYRELIFGDREHRKFKRDIDKAKKEEKTKEKIDEEQRES